MRMIDRRRGQYAVIGVLSLWLLACTGVPEGLILLPALIKTAISAPGMKLPGWTTVLSMV